MTTHYDLDTLTHIVHICDPSAPPEDNLATALEEGDTLDYPADERGRLVIGCGEPEWDALKRALRERGLRLVDAGGHLAVLCLTGDSAEAS